MLEERDDDVIVRIESMFSEMSLKASYNPKIYKVDKTLRQVNERSYDPELVAIGPIHHNKDRVKDMEQLKVSYLYQLLQRENQTVGRYVVKVRELEERARNCYSNFIQLPDAGKFVEMLLLDGFFVIMLLRKLNFGGLRVKNEYIFHSTQTEMRVLVDLLLVENQLPFFILSQLFDMTKSSHPDDNLSSLGLERLCWLLPWKQDVDWLQTDYQIDVDDHLLGMVYGAYFSRTAAKRSSKENLKKYEPINTASELEETGIKFKMVTGANPMDVSFTSDGVVQLPHLSIDDYTETILRNFIAYEQMFPKNHQRYVSDYSILMTYLVKSPKDVEILRRAGILKNILGDDEIVHHMFNQLGKQDVEILRRAGIFRNVLGDDETVHLMFNKLGKHILIDYGNFCHSEVFQSVNRHCRRPRNKWMAVLRRKYFHNPWAILSVIAAIVLLLLAAMQTLYSILSYEK